MGKLENGAAVVFLSQENLVGYTNQYLASLLVKERVKWDGLKIEKEFALNSIYARFHSYFTDFKYLNKDVEYKHIHIYMLDVEFDIEDCQRMEDLAAGLREKGHEVRLFLYHHHITKQELANQYGWHYLDSSRSTTKIL